MRRTSAVEPVEAGPVAGPDAGPVPGPTPGPGPGADADALPAYQRSLQYFALSRLVVAAVLLAYLPLMRGAGGLDERFDPETFVQAAVVYLAVAVGFVAFSAVSRTRLRAIAVAQVAFDVAALSLLLHASGGLRSGLAILLLLPNAGAAILLGARVASFFAAISTLAILGETGWRALHGEAAEGAFVQAGLAGAALLATAAIVGWLAARLSVQERLAWRRGEDLRNQLAVTQAVIGELPEGIVVFDARGAPRAINRAAREMLDGDAAPGAVAGPTAAFDALRAALGLADGARPGEAGELVVPAADGSAGRRLRARRIAVPAGASDVVVVLEDLGRLEALAQQMKLASMGRLSASIAHEIRNPLSAIRHANGLLAEELEGQRLRRLATIVEDNCRRIDRIVEDVLSVARRAPATPEPIPAGPFVAQAVAEWVAQSGVDPRRVECRVREDLPIWFDAGHLRQVVLNLVGNALRHASSARGAVTVVWGVDASGRPALVVADDGPGVPAASRVHLFEPFFTTEARGTGLGLHLARELCTANGATIRYRPACDDPPLRSAFVVEPTSPPAPSR